MSSLFRRGLVGAIYLFLLSPLFFVLAVSINGGTVPSFPPSDLSLRWYGEALRSSAFMGGLANSLWLALLATAVATPIGVMAAFGLTRGHVPGRAAIEAALLSPLIVPGIVIGIATLMWLSALDVRDAAVRLVVGHTLIVLPYSVRTVLAALARFDPSFEEAAIVFGASRRKALWYVTLPMLRQSILAGAIFAFILSFDDVSVALFLTDARTVTLPIAIMSYMQYNFDPSIAAMSAMIILATLGGALAIERLYGLKRFLGN